MEGGIKSLLTIQAGISPFVPLNRPQQEYIEKLYQTVSANKTPDQVLKSLLEQNQQNLISSIQKEKEKDKLGIASPADYLRDPILLKAFLGLSEKLITVDWKPLSHYQEAFTCKELMEELTH